MRGYTNTGSSIQAFEGTSYVQLVKEVAPPLVVVYCNEPTREPA